MDKEEKQKTVSLEGFSNEPRHPKKKQTKDTTRVYKG